MNENRVKDSDLEVDQSSLELEKIKLEREKLAVERYKARWTALSIAVPVLVAIITFGYSSYLESKRSEAEFRLKAFEVLLSNPAQANVKAGMMRDLFPSFKIPDDVIVKLNNYGIQQFNNGLKWDMFRVYANSNRTKKQLTTAYTQLFPVNDEAARMLLMQGVDVGVDQPPNNGMHPTSQQRAPHAR